MRYSNALRGLERVMLKMSRLEHEVYLQILETAKLMKIRHTLVQENARLRMKILKRRGL